MSLQQRFYCPFGVNAQLLDLYNYLLKNAVSPNIYDLIEELLKKWIIIDYPIKRSDYKLEDILSCYLFLNLINNKMKDFDFKNPESVFYKLFKEKFPRLYKAETKIDFGYLNAIHVANSLSSFDNFETLLLPKNVSISCEKLRTAFLQFNKLFEKNYDKDNNYINFDANFPVVGKNLLQ